jgi:hypothetical protein
LSRYCIKTYIFLLFQHQFPLTIPFKEGHNRAERLAAGLLHKAHQGRDRKTIRAEQKTKPRNAQGSSEPHKEQRTAQGTANRAKNSEPRKEQRTAQGTPERA